jgi:ACS family glucarate transporter-like MFS transporter
MIQSRRNDAVKKLNAHRLTLVFLLFCFSTANYFDRIVMTAAGPRMMRDFGLSPTAMGSVYSALVLGYALFMIPGGHLSDRIGARRALALLGIVSALFTALTTLAGTKVVPAWMSTVAVLIAIRFALGIASAPLYPACALVTRNWIPPIFHARVQGLVIAGSSLGAALSPVLFTWLLNRFEWRTAFLPAALAPAALAAVWYWFARDTAPSKEPSVEVLKQARTPTPWLRLLANRNLWLLTCAYAALGYFQYIFFYWMYYYFGQVLHLSEAASARYTGMLFLVEGLIMPLGGLVSDRLAKIRGLQFGRRWVPIASLALAAALTCAGTLSAGLMAVACFSLAFGSAACCEGPFWATVTELGGEHVGSASSILNAGAQVGGFFAPVLTPIIAALFGWSWGLYAGAAIICLGAVAIYFVKIQPAEKSPLAWAFPEPV